MRVGLDIGGTKVAAALLSDSGAVQATTWREHHAAGIDAVVDTLVDALHELESSNGVVDGSPSPVGISVAGLVQRDGTLTSGASLGLQGDLATAVAQRISRPVHVFNDAEATLRSVLHAHHTQTGTRLRDAVLLTIGTGIGGAIVSDGRPLRGRSGLATELGHLPVQPPTAELCVCGSSGCLEQYAGGKGIAALANKAVRDNVASACLREVDAATTAGLTTKDVVEAARAGDPTAMRLIEHAAHLCAQAIRALCVTVEPDVIFLGGSVAHGAAELLVPRIVDEVRRHWSFANLTAPPLIQLDPIGPHAAAIGAALLMNDFARQPSDGTSIHTALEGTAND